jgi:hypothetical protein
MFKLFILFELRKFNKYFKTKRAAKVITTLLFVVVFLIVGIGMYHFLESSFRYINAEAEEEIKQGLTLLLYEIFSLVLGGIVIFSTAVSALFNLFRGRNNTWLISTPGYTIFPKIIFLRGVINALIPLLILCIPTLLALDHVYHFGIVGLFSILISLLFFVIMTTGITLIVLLTVSFLYYKLSLVVPKISFRFKGLLAFLFVDSLFLIYKLWKLVAAVDLVQLFRGNETTHIVHISDISSQFNLLLTHPFAMEIISWQTNQIVPAIFYMGVLLILSCITMVTWWYISPLYYPLWQKFQEGTTAIDTKKNLLFSPSVTYTFSGSAMEVLFKKEFLISSRNFKGVIWFFFLWCIWLLQIAANVLLNHTTQEYQADLSQKIIILQVLQFIIAVYFMSSFALRFVLPSFSVEKRTAWILGSAPLSFRKIFFGKYVFYTVFFVIFGVVMNYINVYALHLSFMYGTFSMLLFISVVMFIVTLALSLGALFPNRDTDDPEAITTSIPGLFFTALALMYGGLSDLVLYGTLKYGFVWLLFLFIILTYVLIGYMLLKMYSFPNKMRSF